MNKFLALFALLAWTADSHASFSEKTKRYVSPKDMFTLLTQKFPVLNSPAKIHELKTSCWALGENNTNVTGLVNPAIGLPATTQPGAGFVRWWGSCADTIIKKQFGILKTNPVFEKLWRRYWALSVLDRFRDKNNTADPYHQLSELEWKEINDKTKDTQIRYLIEEWIGPNPVVRDLGFVKGTDELIGIIKATIDPNSTLKFIEANEQLILAVMLREEFLTY